MNLQPVSEPPDFRAICKLCGKEIPHGEKLADLVAETNTYYHAECMRPRTEVEEAYPTDGYGHIVSPGKFEGEPLYVPYFWDLYLEGAADEDDGETLTFKVDAKDRIVFPELEDKEFVYLFETEQGFVCEVDKPTEESDEEAYA